MEVCDRDDRGMCGSCREEIAGNEEKTDPNFASIGHRYTIDCIQDERFLTVFYETNPN
jgi:hypothetical protein